MRRHGEEVLRQSVVDLSRDARSLLRDRAAELREANRPPDADEQDGVREQAQEIAGGDEAVGDQRCEDVVQVAEEKQGRAKGKPAVEIVAARPEAKAEADHGDQARQGARRHHRGEQPRLNVVARAQRRERIAERVGKDPEQQHESRHEHQQLDQLFAPRRRAFAGEGRRGDQRGREDAAPDPGPLLSPVQQLAPENRRDPEAEGRAGREREAGAEEQVEPPAVHREPDTGEHRDEHCCERDHRVQDEPHLRQLESRP